MTLDPEDEAIHTPAADPEQLAVAEDNYLRQQLGEPYEWPDPERQYRTAEARADALDKPTNEGETA